MFLEGLKLSYTQKLEKSTSATPKCMDGKPRKLRVPNGAKVRGVDLIRQVGPIPERGQEITVTYCGAVRDRAALDRLNLEPRDAAIRYAYYVRTSDDLFVFVLIPGEENPRWIKLGN